MGRSPDDNVRERRKKALALKLAGVDYQTIMERVPGYSSPAHVGLDIQRAREIARAELTESVEELRQVQDDRLNRLLVACWGNALKGDVKSIDTASRLIQQMCKLHGLDAPTQIQLTARMDLEATIVSETLLAVVDSLGLPPEMRVRALDLAQQRMLAIAESGVDQVS